MTEKTINYIKLPDGETYRVGGGSGFNLFDTKVSDHVLEGEEALGWALQGTYVYKEAIAGSRFGYPDFYAKCLEEYENATSTETVNSVAVKVYSNGHKFYDIANKSAIDTFYNTYGIADFYGVDTENERIFLPRNNKFVQLTGDTSKVNNTIEAGLPNITGSFTSGYYIGKGTTSGAFVENGSIGSAEPDGGSRSAPKIDFNASKSSSIYGNSNTVQPPSSLKLLYYCVGNTKVESAVSNVTEITTSENDTLPLLHHIPADEMLEHPAWLRSQGQWNSGSVYTTVYSYLVNEYQTGSEHTDTLKASNGTEYTVTYKTVKGKKVVDVANVGQVDAVYSAIGSAWYYVINQDDMTFRLPMSHNSECYTSDPLRVGLDVSAGLPNITGSIFTYNSASTPIDAKGAFYSSDINSPNASTSSGGGNGVRFNLDASRSNPIYGNSNTVTPPHTEFYLYFKVANAVTNLEILDAGKVMSVVNTVVPDNASLISSYGMPSNNWISLTLGSAGSNYTAPANGYVLIRKFSNAIGQHLTAFNNSGIGDTKVSSIASQALWVWFPVKKGETFHVNYTAGGTTELFRFIYAEGDK